MTKSYPIAFQQDRCATTSSTRSRVLTGHMEHTAREHGTPSSFRYLRMVTPHASNWLYAELWAFRWWVKHEFNTGLATGYTLDSDLIAMSTRTANVTLATMPYVEIEATSHRPGTLPLHQEQPYHQTMPSSSTAGTPRLRSGSSYPSPRQAKTTRPHSTLPTNGSFWLNWYGKPGRYRLSRDCRHIGPQHTRASEMPSSRLNRTYPRGRPKWPYWITKNSLPPRPAQTFGPWSLNNFSDW